MLGELQTPITTYSLIPSHFKHTAHWYPVIMPPQIDRRPFVRNKNSKGPVESPPPKSIVSDQEILRRGCPGAPKKEPPSGSRKRYRPTGFVVIDDDERNDDARVEPLVPRQLFPVSVEGLPKPTARRALPRQLPSPSRPMTPNEMLTPPSAPDASALNFG